MNLEVNNQCTSISTVLSWSFDDVTRHLAQRLTTYSRRFSFATYVLFTLPLSCLIDFMPAHERKPWFPPALPPFAV